MSSFASQIVAGLHERRPCDAGEGGLSLVLFVMACLMLCCPPGVLSMKKARRLAGLVVISELAQMLRRSAAPPREANECQAKERPDD